MTQHVLSNLALTLFAGAALASNAAVLPEPPQEDKELKGNFDQPLAGHGEAHAGGQSGSFSMKMIESGPEGNYSLTIENDKVRAEVNGKPVPQDRIRRGKDKVEILGDDGQVLKTFNLGQSDGNVLQLGTPRAPRAPRSRVEAPKPPAPPQAPNPEVMKNLRQLAPQQMALPPVMLGVTMSDDDDGVELDSVLEGLPAEKAGLEEGDIITAADGKTKIDQAKLRAILREKKPGDEIKLTVKHDDKTREVTVKLDAYDPQRLHLNGNSVVVSGHDWRDELKKHLEQLKEELAAKNVDIEQLRKSAQEHLDQALAELEQAHVQLRGWMNSDDNEMARRFEDAFSRLREFPRVVSPDGGNTFVVPTPNAPQPARPDDRKLDRVMEQLDRLNHRLDEIEKRVGDKK